MKLLTACCLALLLTTNTQVKAEETTKDCVIVAAIAYNKLQAAGLWSEVIGVVGFNAKGKPSKHAMVAFQVRPETSIFIYDAGGSIALETTSKDLKDIETALSTLMETKKLGKLTKLTVIVPNKTY